MNLDKICLDLIQKKHPKTIIIGLRGLIKTDEFEYSFRHVFQDGNYLSLSDLDRIIIKPNEKPFLIEKNK